MGIFSFVGIFSIHAMVRAQTVENDAWRRGSGPKDHLQHVGMSSQYFVVFVMEHETHPQGPAPREPALSTPCRRCFDEKCQRSGRSPARSRYFSILPPVEGVCGGGMVVGMGAVGAADALLYILNTTTPNKIRRYYGHF